MIATVIVYTYKRTDYIIRAVNSLSRQSIGRENIEIIVVKGFSDEEIDAFLSENADKSFVVDEKAHGKKLSAGITAATGDYIFLMDDDDEFEENKIKMVVDKFRANEQISFIHNSIHRIGEDGKYLKGLREATPKQDIVLDTNKVNRANISKFFRYRANWYSSCMAFKIEVLKRNLNLIDQVYQSVDPFLFLCALNFEGLMLLIPDRLTKYRIHTSTTNYKIAFDKYIESKVLFYKRSAEIVNLSKNMIRRRELEPFVNAYLMHNYFMSQILMPDAGRKHDYQSVIEYIPALNYVFVSYYMIWIAFGFFKFVSGPISLKFFYLFSTKNAS